MKTIVVASLNLGKISEIQEILSDLPVDIQSLDRYADIPAVVEDGATYFENALKKARTISEYTHEMVLADDSGLEVESLKGEPGIFSARYAGGNATDHDNNLKLLEKMKGLPAEKRGAAFRCVLVLYEPGGKYHSFRGRWVGRIAESLRGDRGFGYDPIFFLPERGLTVAELSPEEKNRSSHRAQALEALKKHLKNSMTAGN